MRNRIKNRLPRAIERQILWQPLRNVKDIAHRPEPIARGGAGPVHIQRSMTVALLCIEPFANARLLRNQKRRERLQQRVVNAINPLRIGMLRDRDERKRIRRGKKRIERAA